MMRSQKVLALTLVLTLACVCVAQAQGPQGGRRGPGMMGGRGGLLGLLRSEQVQDEMKLTDEQKTKVNEAIQKIGEEMREEFGALREMEDRTQVREKMEELSDKADEKLREALRDSGLEREQVMRLYQIRIQLQPLADTLSNPFVARRLELTDDQKAKVKEAVEKSQEEQRALMADLRDATAEARGEAFAKVRELREKGEKALQEILTDEQKEQLEEMKGEKFELQRPERPEERRRPAEA